MHWDFRYLLNITHCNSNTKLFSPSHLSALNYGHVLIRFVPCGPSIFDHVDNIHTLHDLAKHNMFVVQEGRRHCGDEELATVCIWSRILQKC